jgi:hypothetical protein
VKLVQDYVSHLVRGIHFDLLCKQSTGCMDLEYSKSAAKTLFLVA